jgi:hypothetical protein
MTVYNLAQVRYSLSPNRAKLDPGLPSEEGITVHACDTQLLKFIFSVFTLRVEQDPDSIRIISGPYYHSISNVVEENGQKTARETKAIDGLYWELLESLCSQGWEPFSSNNNSATPLTYSKEYCFRKARD